MIVFRASHLEVCRLIVFRASHLEVCRLCSGLAIQRCAD